VLTSLGRGDPDDLGFSGDLGQLVLSRARRALAAGVDGIVSSGLEAPMIRRELGDKLMVVTPGIRPVENKSVDDQERTVDVAQAFNDGAVGKAKMKESKFPPWREEERVRRVLAHYEPQTREQAVGPNIDRLTSVCRQRTLTSP